MRAILCMLSIVVIAGCSQKEPKNWAECILKDMPGVSNESARSAVHRNCRTNFPEMDYTIKKGSNLGFGADFKNRDECVIEKNKNTINKNASININIACSCLYEEPSFDGEMCDYKKNKPWEMDWKDNKNQTHNQQNYFDQFDEKTSKEEKPVSAPNYKTDLNTNNSTQSAEQEHYDAILKVHPDALQIVKQPSFQAWIDSQSPEWRKYYNDVTDTGNADQVIELLNDYKNNIIH
ncbi:hypothetical protein B9T38_11885 [Acinetobacter sp. ANC 4218]|uniref:hypothetical protein n=1 Tax=Acinetobacter sp. ANC 4218 TaxID=1977880 RepID=UPI000A32F084|nr:hypothetical protein [Acinetobacter sp. ANC 4218]OTG70557.1 hypothetical protein B9T38_11885 [Acinetobacter sp. ANC 4218]